MSDQNVPATTINVEQYIGKLVQIRDKIKAMQDDLDAQLKPYKEAKQRIEALLLNILDNNKLSNMKTGAGTASVLDKWTAVVDDPNQFRDFVFRNNMFDLADLRANATACQDYLKDHQALPPGVRLNNFRSVGVRRATTKTAE